MRTKKSALILAMICLIVLAFSSVFANDTIIVNAFAESRINDADGFEYVLLDDGTASITACTLSGDIAIPSSIDGHKVTNLAAQLFYGNASVTSVSIPASVTYFGKDPSDNMWDYVFSYCYSLTAINVDSGNPSFRSVDGVLYSKDMSTLYNYPCEHPGSEYTVPSTVDWLCCTSFATAHSLTQLSIENPDAGWATYTFYNCGGLTVYYYKGGYSETCAKKHIKNGLSHETDESYPTYRALEASPTTTPTTAPSASPDPTADPSAPVTTEPTLTPDPTNPSEPTAAPDPTSVPGPTAAPGPEVGTPITTGDADYEVTAPGEVSYKGPVKSKAKVTIPATIVSGDVTLKVTSIADSAFLKDKKLKTITIGANIEIIGANAFKSCAKLTTVKGGEALMAIGDNAFKGCVKLKKFTIGDNVEYIGKKAFNGCKALKTITVKTELLTAENVGKAAFSGINKKATFKCPKASLKAYKKLLVKKGAPKSCKFK